MSDVFGFLRKQSNTHFQFILRFAIIVIVGAILLIGSRLRSPNQEAAVSRAGDYATITTLDDVSAAEIAATIARDADLLVANNVRNMADSLSAQSEFSSPEGTFLVKPQVVATDAKTSNDIVEYTVQKNDTLDTVARRFNVTTDSIRWANDITGSLVSEGRKLTIPPVSGIIYTVKQGDTPKSIAQKYKANTEQVIAFNDAEIDGIKKGQKIIVPNGQLPAPPAPVYIAAGSTAVASTGFSFGSQPLYGGNGYSYGYCTWHAANRRLALGLAMPRNLGNAVTWATLGAQAGLDVGGIPRAGAILWHKNTYIAGGLGHVGFVEKVNEDGSVLISDMNYPIWGVATNRTISQAEISSYLYIY